MKRKIIISFLLIAIWGKVNAQNSESALVEYKIYTDRASVYEHLPFSTDTVKGILKFNSNQSSFQINTGKNGRRNINQIFAGGQDLFYRDSSKNEFIQQTTKLKEPYRITLETLDWTIMSEQRVINNYLCVKAIRKKEDLNGDGLAEKGEIIAWFTPEIPVPYGPSKYGGLPGLIVQCEYGNTIIKLNKVHWNEEELKILEPNLGDEITLESFKEIALKKYPDFSSSTPIDWQKWLNN